MTWVLWVLFLRFTCIGNILLLMILEISDIRIPSAPATHRANKAIGSKKNLGHSHQRKIFPSFGARKETATRKEPKRRSRRLGRQRVTAALFRAARPLMYCSTDALFLLALSLAAPTLLSKPSPPATPRIAALKSG